MKYITDEEKAQHNLKVKQQVQANPELHKLVYGIVWVKNVAGSAKRSPKCPNCGPWKDHWKMFSKDPWPTKCSVLTCNALADRGGHVVDANDKRNREYIVPMCEKCNGKSPDDKFMLDIGTVMISANCSDTCDKFIK